nr:mediator of RNA polymerase II transcription subunit 19a-like [Ipomoea trifida]
MTRLARSPFESTGSSLALPLGQPDFTPRRFLPLFQIEGVASPSTQHSIPLALPIRFHAQISVYYYTRAWSSSSANPFKLLPHHEYFCKRQLPLSISDTDYLHNVVGDTEIRKGEGMQLDQLIEDASFSREMNASIKPFDLDVLGEAFQLRETSPIDLSSKRKHDGEEDINDHKHKKSKHKSSKIDEMGAIKKRSVDEYEKGERLDLEDNDPEYETKEYGGPDYDDRGIEREEVQEEGEEIEEHEEEYIGDEGEGDMVEEEVEDVNENLESEEDDDHVGEEHGQMVDEAEEDEHDEVVKERRKRKKLENFIDVVS